jgi:hypothetical protein
MCASTEPRPTKPRKQIGIRTVSLALLEESDRMYHLVSCTFEIGIVHNSVETERSARVDFGPERTAARRSLAAAQCSVAAARCHVAGCWPVADRRDCLTGCS